MCYGTKPLPQFDDYASEQHIENEVDFWKAALEFQKTKFSSHEQAKKTARSIYNRYLVSESPNAIFLSRRVVSRIKADLKRKYITSIYQEALLEISGLLSSHLSNFASKHGIKISFPVFSVERVLTATNSAKY